MKSSFADIREFIEFLDSRGQLLRVRDAVSADLEISKITDAESKKPGGGMALLFENVLDGGRRSFPVATNLFGSSDRMAWALGVGDIREIERRIESIVSLAPPRGLGEIWEAAKKLLPLARILPKKFRGKLAPCQEIAEIGEEVDLSRIPVLKCWPHDGGRFVTLPLVFTKSLDSKRRNLGMYRLQVYDKNTTGMHWHIHKDAAHFYGEYRAAGRRMPVAVAIGADPATIYSATAPLPRGMDELLLSGFLRGRGVRLVKCKTVDLEVPADAEFVLEGYVEPDELRLEGPFGDHTGYYSLADMYPVFHVTAVTRRRNPVYCATLVGPPPMEDCYMAKATERIFLPLLKTVLPEISDYFLPWEGVFHNITIVSMRKEFPAHARRLACGLWGQGQMSFSKAVVLVDSDIDPSDLEKIWRLFIDSFDPVADVHLSEGVLDALDHSAPSPLCGSKIAIDLTRRVGGEPERARFPIRPPTKEDMESAQDFARSQIGGIERMAFKEGFCAIALDKAGRRGADILEKIRDCGLFDGKFRAVAIFDADVNPEDTSKILWKIFNNTDPRRDILVSAKSGLCLVDACKKTLSDGHAREWPQELTFEG